MHWPFFLPLFTEVRGIGFLRTSPFGDSPKFACRLLHRLEEARAAVEVALIEARRAYVSTVRDVD